MVSASQRKKRLRRIRDKRGKNVRFEDLQWLLEAYGFEFDRQKSSHCIYTHELLEQLVTIPRPHHSPTVLPAYCRQVLKAIDDIIDLEGDNSDDD